VSLERGQRIAIVVGVAITAGVAASALTYMYAGRTFDARKLIESLPPDRATHVYIDVDALRKSGVLDMIAGAKAAEEPDYRKFVEQTGFDYRTDLDAAAIAFIHGNTYMALRGRFKSDRLGSYARAEGGLCRGKICSMQGSQPNRKISFYPIRSSVLALAVTPEETGATLIGPAQWKKSAIVPGDPVWISVPAFELADVKDFPAGTHAFLRPLSLAQEVAFSIGPAKSGELEIRLDALCETVAIAEQIVNRLTIATDLLNKMLQREKMKANPHDLSGLLTAGIFKQQDKRVTGHWPLDRGFVESLASGKVE
jgi:hypothetical protein